MTLLLRFSFVMDNLHCLLNAYYYVFRNHIKTIRTSRELSTSILCENTKISVWKIRQSQCGKSTSFQHFFLRVQGSELAGAWTGTLLSELGSERGCAGAANYKNPLDRVETP